MLVNTRSLEVSMVWTEGDENLVEIDGDAFLAYVGNETISMAKHRALARFHEFERRICFSGEFDLAGFEVEWYEQLPGSISQLDTLENYINQRKYVPVFGSKRSRSPGHEPNVVYLFPETLRELARTLEGMMEKGLNEAWGFSDDVRLHIECQSRIIEQLHMFAQQVEEGISEVKVTL